MSELLKSFDSYNEFERSSYFTLMYDALASNVSLDIPFEESKESLDKILSKLKLLDKRYEIVFKNWNTEDASNADFSKDFPFQLLFQSRINKSIVWISLDNEELSVEFYYDCKNLELEKDILSMNHLLRTSFGLSRAPTFKVLTRHRSGFQTEDVRTEKVEINLQEHYNDDFISEFEKMENALTTNKSGLILLYGKPGTGKTTLIRGFISKNENLNFIFIQNEFVKNLLEPDFISFLLKQRNSILVIEDAEKVIISRERLKEESVVSTILQLTDGLFSDYLNIKIICTFNVSLSEIDKALLRKGRIISKYEFQELELKKTNKLLEKLNSKISNKGLTLAEIFNRYDKEYVESENTKIGF